MNLSLIVTIAVIVFLLLFLALGFWRGFLRILLTTCSLVLTLVLAGALAQPLSGFIEDQSVIGTRVKERIQVYVSDRLSGISDTTADAEEALIHSLPLPSSIKQDLEERNTVSGYLSQGVNTFSEYLASNLTHLVIQILSYIVLFIVIYLILRLILRLSNLINHVPLLGGVNRVFGGVIGLAEGVLFLWVFCLVIMMMSGTEFGQTCEGVIRDSVFLSFIYEHNYLLVLGQAIAGVM